MKIQLLFGVPNDTTVDSYIPTLLAAEDEYSEDGTIPDAVVKCGAHYTLRLLEVSLPTETIEAAFRTACIPLEGDAVKEIPIPEAEARTLPRLVE